MLSWQQSGILLFALCMAFGSHRVLRWPLLLISAIHVTLELSVVAVLVAFMGMWDAFVQRLRPTKSRSRLLAGLEAAMSWEDYFRIAEQLDAEEGCAAWRAKPEHSQYNSSLVRSMVNRLNQTRQSGDADALLTALGVCVRKSFCGIDVEPLYARCRTGTKHLIEQFIDEVVASLAQVQSELGQDEAFDNRVRSFLHRSQRVFGRTCLSLSGGGGLSNYSWGVVRALFRRGQLPNLICGTSAGAVVAATLCTRTDAELEQLLRPETLVPLLTSFEESRMQVLRRFVREGHMYDAAHWTPKIEAMCNHAAHPNITFAEAYALSGRELCVTVTARRRHEPPLVLSRLGSPDVTVVSAILATVAMPFLIPAQTLMVKRSDGRLYPWHAAVEPASDNAEARWRDGSIVHDTPREQLAQHFGVSFIIASQCNPHVVPLFIALRPTAGRPAISRLQRGRSEWRGGFAVSALLVWLLSDAKKWLTFMRELEIMPLILDTDWSDLFLQDFTGDVTIMPPLSVLDYTRVLSDPTLSSMSYCIRVGERETWRKQPMLATRLRIAHALQALQASLDELQHTSSASETQRFL